MTYKQYERMLRKVWKTWLDYGGSESHSPFNFISDVPELRANEEYILLLKAIKEAFNKNLGWGVNNPFMGETM